MPIGGAYRLIDVPMSNCINSGISKMYILTQFQSTSLNRHLVRAYNMGSGVRFGGDGFVEVLAATQTPTDKEWFQVRGLEGRGRGGRTAAGRLPGAARHPAWALGVAQAAAQALSLARRLGPTGTASPTAGCRRGVAGTPIPSLTCAHTRPPSIHPSIHPHPSSLVQGTADAVRQYSWLLEDTKNRAIEDVLILSGDHL